MRRTMKKFAALCLIFVLVVGVLSGCGDLTDSINDFTLDTSNTFTTRPLETNPTTAEGEQEEPPTQPSIEETTPSTTVGNTEDDVIDPAFKEAMDSYEAFFDEYVEIMKKYKANPTDLDILSDYMEYMGQYADMMEKFGKWENEDLNDAELVYYLEVQARVTKKLQEVAN